MPVSPDDFEDIAQGIDSEFDNEMGRRVSISTRYYYIFHKVREENDSHPDSQFTYRSGDHQEASRFLERMGYHGLSDEYDDLRNKRNKADYDIDERIGSFEFQMFLADLNDFERKARNEDIIS